VLGGGCGCEWVLLAVCCVKALHRMLSGNWRIRAGRARRWAGAWVPYQTLCLQLDHQAAQCCCGA
jgi:hypothetical protein